MANLQVAYNAQTNTMTVRETEKGLEKDFKCTNCRREFNKWSGGMRWWGSCICPNCVSTGGLKRFISSCLNFDQEKIERAIDFETRRI